MRRKKSFAARGVRNVRDLLKWLRNGSKDGRWSDFKAHMKRNKCKYILAALAAAHLYGHKYRTRSHNIGNIDKDGSLFKPATWGEYLQPVGVFWHARVKGVYGFTNLGLSF